MADEHRIPRLIDTRLRAAFRVRRLRVEDESASHRGHAGWQAGGWSHVHIALDAEDLDALPLLARHRAVHAALGPDLVAEIHALRLTLGRA